MAFGNQMDSAIVQLRDLLPVEKIHEQLVAGGEAGLNESTLRRWLIARKVQQQQCQLAVLVFAADPQFMRRACRADGRGSSSCRPHKACSLAGVMDPKQAGVGGMSAAQCRCSRASGLLQLA
jgi:hypothetical protein